MSAEAIGYTNTVELARDRVLAFIVEQIARYGISPTHGEIAAHIGVSNTRAKQLVQQLVERGAIEHTPGAQRSLRVVDMVASRKMLTLTLQRLGWMPSAPMEALQVHHSRGPIVAYLEHVSPAALKLPYEIGGEGTS